jgi:hypothetical protein
MFQLIMQEIHYLNDNLDFFYNSKLIKIKNLNKYRVLKLDVNYIYKINDYICNGKSPYK